jgi:HEAT repeat protein
MKHLKWLWIILLGFVSAGCSLLHHNKSGPPVVAMPSVQDVKPAPPYHPMALDPGLHQAAVNELLAECHASDSYIRSNAIEGLSEAAPVDAPGPVLKGLSDSKPNVRYAAAIAAGELRMKSAYRPLLAMAYDPDLRVQVAVRFALHRLGDLRLSHQLEVFSMDNDPRVRAVTAQVLGMLQEPSAVKVLQPMLQDPVPANRLQVAEALWRLGDQQGLDALIGFSLSAYPDDQIIAIIGLAEPHDDRVIGQIRADLTSDFMEVSLVAARALGMLGSDEGWNVAVPMVKSDDPRRRSLAALALGAIGRTDLQPILAPLLKDSEATVRISAATAILELHAS